MDNQENIKETQDQQEISSILKEIGFNSIEEIKELKKQIDSLQKQVKEKDNISEKVKQLENLYKLEKARAEIIKHSTTLGAIDPEDIFIFIKDKVDITEDGKITIGNKAVQEYLRDLKEKKPHWFKASDKEGSGSPQAREPKQELSTKEKLAKLLRI